jgi:hypothetical protein
VLKKFSLIFLVPALLGGCAVSGPTADQVDSRQQEAQLKQAQQQTGLPNITNYTEKKLAKMLLELRDEQKIPTYSYISNQTGLYFLCNSLGYGIPYATQITNPEKIETSPYSDTAWGITRPQAEPNGLFMPASADATWTICNDGKGGIVPVYVEAHLVVSPFKLNPTGTWGGSPSIKSKKLEGKK